MYIHTHKNLLEVYIARFKCLSLDGGGTAQLIYIS